MLRTWLSKLVSLFLKRQLDNDLNQEISAHLEMAVADNIRRGMSPAAASRAARRSFGGVDKMKEHHRDIRGFRWLDDLVRDLRIGGRGLAKRPGFTTVAVLTLALGIGATTTIFSVVDGVLLRPLDYDEPDRLVMIWETNTSTAEGSASVLNFVDWRAQNRVFESMAAWLMRGTTLSGGDMAERINVARVTEDFFAVMRARPHLGRVFRPDEQYEGSHRVALLHHDLWQRRYGGDPAVIGEGIRLNGDRFTIVGVMASEFRFPTTADVWTPLVLDPSGGRHDHQLQVVARRMPAVTLVQSQADMTHVSEQIALAHTGMRDWSSRVVPLKDQMVRNARSRLVVLMTAVGLVLLIACANVANLLFVRASARRREVTIRAAVGAGRGRLIRQFLAESALLAMLGGGLGVTASRWGVDALKGVAASSFPLLDRVHLDLRVVGFTLALTVAASLLAGLAPALHGSRTGAGPAQQGCGRRGVTRQHQGGGLIAAEVALSLTLLVGAGLLIESFVRLARVDVGFNSDRLVTMRVGLSAANYPGGRQVSNFYAGLLDELRSLPGVAAVAAVSDLPIGGAFGGFFIAKPGGAFFPSDGPALSAAYHVVSEGYHEAMGIPLVRGRYLSARDTETTPFAVVITETMARRYWPNSDPLGQQIQVRLPDEHGTIVGIVGDVKQGGLRRDYQPAMYFSHIQAARHPALAEHTEPMWRQQAITLRTTSDPARVISAARARIHARDPRLPTYSVQTMDMIKAESVSAARFTTTLLGLFAFLASTLAAVGIYAVVSYTVTGRRQEIGVRMALGATHRDITRSFVGRGMRPVLVGLSIGLAGAAALSRLLADQLFGVSAVNLPTYGAVAALLAGCALAACLVPAARAARVDPMSALRLE
jgi:putative ABC transport system permease protein